MTNTIAQYLPIELITQLRSAFPNHDHDPLLLAKITTEDGEVYYPISMYADRAGQSRITCFDPGVYAAYHVLFGSALEGSRVCPDFQPARLSQVDPDWFKKAAEADPDTWP